MSWNKTNKPNYRSVIIVMSCTLIGFVLTFYSLKASFLEQYEIPSKINIIVKDNTGYELEVINKDTLVQSAINTSSGINIFAKDVIFQRNPIFMVWGLLIVILITIASGAFPVFIWQNLQLSKKFNLSKKQIFSSLLFTLVLLSVMIIIFYSFEGYKRPPYFVDNLKILLKDGNFLIIISFVTVLLSIPVVLIFFIIGYSLENLSFDKSDKTGFEKSASQIEYLNRILQAALQVFAVIVVFSILTSSALRESIKTVVEIKGFDILPKEMSYVYGLYYTLFLGILYIPTYMFLRYRKEELLKELISIQNPENEKWVQKVTADMNEKNSMFDNIKLSLTVLSPLITSFLPEQLNIFK